MKVLALLALAASGASVEVASIGASDETSFAAGAGGASTIETHFSEPKNNVAHSKACFKHSSLPVDALVEPFVDADKDLFRNPYVKTSRDGGSMTWAYEREPSTVEEALALLREEDLSYVLRYERLDVSEWPEALAALIPANLKEELIADLADGGTTVHLYLSAPDTSALPEHKDIGDVLVLQLAGEKEWTIDGGHVTMEPGDALWIPVGAKHSAQSSKDDLSAHLTIHRVTEEHKRRLNHKTGDDGTDDDATWNDNTCFPFGDAGCYGCPCNLCNICATDSGAFCTTKAEDVAVVDPCCGNGDYDDCTANAGKPQDVAFWFSLKDTSKGCGWVNGDPGSRCKEKGVYLGTFSNQNRPFASDRAVDHYGRQWLIDNQPRYKAQDACPVACKDSGGGGGGGDKCDCEDDKKWKYDAGDKGRKNCKHIASGTNEEKKKRCKRDGDGGKKGKEACPCACKDFGGKCPGGGGGGGKPTCKNSKKDAKNWRYKGMNCKKASKEGKCGKKGKDTKTDVKAKGSDACCKSCACFDEEDFFYREEESCGNQCTRVTERKCDWFKKNRDKCNKKGFLNDKKVKAKDACPKSCKTC